MRLFGGVRFLGDLSFSHCLADTRTQIYFEVDSCLHVTKMHSLCSPKDAPENARSKLSRENPHSSDLPEYVFICTLQLYSYSVVRSDYYLVHHIWTIAAF